MMSEVKFESSSDLQSISFDSDISNHNNINNYNNIYNETLLNPSKKHNDCCYQLALWWFFHSTLGAPDYTDNSKIERTACFFCNICIWCFEFKLKFKCCIQDFGCCCISCYFN